MAEQRVIHFSRELPPAETRGGHAESQQPPLCSCHRFPVIHWQELQPIFSVIAALHHRCNREWGTATMERKLLSQGLASVIEAPAQFSEEHLGHLAKEAANRRVAELGSPAEVSAWLATLLISVVVLALGADIYRAIKAAAAKLFRRTAAKGRAKAGGYHGITSPRNRMEVPEDASTSIALNLSGEDYWLSPLSASKDEREATFDCLCNPLGHSVGRAAWRPYWEKNPNWLLLTVTFAAGNRTVREVFRRDRQP